MTLDTQLYKGNLICLGPIDHEKDPPVMARWTGDPEYLRMLSQQPALPLSAAQMKKRVEALEKQIDEEKNLFYFTIRKLSDDLAENDRLVGFARLYWIEWSLGIGRLQLGIGDSGDRNQGYGTETLKLLLHFCFCELNLFAIRAVIPEYNQPALHLFQKSGFSIEVRQRQEIHRDGKRWDLMHVGLLQSEWETIA